MTLSVSVLTYCRKESLGGNGSPLNLVRSVRRLLVVKLLQRMQVGRFSFLFGK